MIVKKMARPKRLFEWTKHHILALTLWALTACFLYEQTPLKGFVFPWLPVSLLGTAVAFYLGFKNNSAYDRLWEARKIWGAIVNSSRSWGAYIKAFVGNQFREKPLSPEELTLIHKRILYRHLAWIYSLRSQLLLVKEWEHAAQDGCVGRIAKHYQDNFGVGLVADEVTRLELTEYLPKEELQETINFQNTATQIIDTQSQDLASLRADNLIDDFRHVELQRILSDLYQHQGKLERIKGYPLPRQYANSGTIFVGLFLALLPFCMMSEFAKLGPYGVWWSIPFVVLIGWVFVIMETVGDYSENPFQGMANDIPMLSICRTIEIDILEMLRETDIPKPIQAKEGVLM